MNSTEDVMLSIFTALIKKSDQHPEGNAKINSKEKVMEPYRNNKPTGITDEINALLSSYESKGMISISWYTLNVAIKFIRLIDGDQLANNIGIERYNERMKRSVKRLDETFKEGAYRIIRQDIISKWGEAKPYQGVHADDAAKLILTISGANAVLENEGKMEDIDYRHLSTQLYADSKILNTRLISIANIIKTVRTNLDSHLEPKDVLQLFGVVPLAHPTYISGPLLFTSVDNKSIQTDFPPAVGLWGQQVQSVSPVRNITKITSIENLATFMRYVRKEKDENEVVLYSGGIPSPAYRLVYKMIIQELPEVDLYHWGDIDLGGFIILSMMEEIAGKTVIGYRMSNKDYNLKDYDKKMTKLEVDRLKLIQLTNANKVILEGAICAEQKFEQEAYYN